MASLRRTGLLLGRNALGVPFLVLFCILLLLVMDLTVEFGESEFKWVAFAVAWGVVGSAAWVHIINRERILTPFNFFLASLIGFHLPRVLFYTYEESYAFTDFNSPLWIDFPLQTLKSGIFTTLISIQLFIIGAAVADKVNGIRRGVVATYNKNVKGEQIAVLCILAATFVPFLIIEYGRINLAATGGYQTILAVGASAGYPSFLLILSHLFIAGLVFAYAVFSRHAILAHVTLLLVIAYVLAEMYIGDRSKGISLLLSILFLYDQLRRRIPLKAILIVGVVLFVGLSFVQVVRMVPGGERNYIEAGSMLITDIGSVFSFLLGTMGNSLGAVLHTVENVPANEEYSLGLEYLIGLTNVFPSIFGGSHVVPEYLPSLWLSKLLIPGAVESGRGTGYSIIAEAYYNFGFLGPVTVMLLLGILGKAMQNWALRSGDVCKLAMIGSFFVWMYSVPRGVLATFLRPLVWYALTPYVVCKIVKSLAVSGRRSREIEILANTPWVGEHPHDPNPGVKDS